MTTVPINTRTVAIGDQTLALLALAARRAVELAWQPPERLVETVHNAALEADHALAGGMPHVPAVRPAGTVLVQREDLERVLDVAENYVGVEDGYRRLRHAVQDPTA